MTRLTHLATGVSIAAAALLIASSASAQSLACNGYLVGKGASPATLLQTCGEPVYRQMVCEPMVQLGWVLTPYRPGSPEAVLATQCVPMEEWTYDRGPGTFFGIVRIYNGTIESVRDGDRGR
ncbi:DUF2845 domain-containing protein [Variovorax sp. KBS0712]|uniref:DUF2845 domain-containing protein n=1 Tax=Variovorax sp. KBS0712 TaxID=2578111 RepID=UPI00111A8AA6|nr:DUF2845 domain-containing protein [Variovorax sp. KBS0712]TSD61285.1 DUF2845 domain-containing protein [Variovorax sp. KBS0712]